MEFQKTINSLDITSGDKDLLKKKIEVYDRLEKKLQY